MLPLRLKQFRLPKRLSFLGKLIAFSFVLHLIILISCVIVIGKKDKLIIPIHLQDAAVVVMPFVKSVGEVMAPLQTKNGSSTEKSQTTFVEKAAASPKSIPLKKAVPKKAVLKKTPVKKSEPKKIAPKKVEPKKTEPKRVESKKAKVPQATSPKNPAIKKVVQQSGADETIAIGRDDATLLSLILELKNEIEQSWERPTGLPSDVCYTVNLYIDSKGNVSVKDEKSSGALALDITARSFFVSYNFPKRVWGREIELTL
jgi:hypothetical protein